MVWCWRLRRLRPITMTASRCCICSIKPISSRKHRATLKSRGIKNGIQDKAVKNNPLMPRQLQRNNLITKIRYVVERIFGSQARWFNAKIVRYRGVAKAHAWHSLLAMAYNLKRLHELFANSRIITQTKGYCALSTDNNRLGVIFPGSFAKKGLKNTR